MRRAIGPSAVSIVLCALVGSGSPARAFEATELAIKAAFLYKFGFFVEWPQTSFASSDSPMNLCIVGDDTFGTLLDETVKGKKIGTRAIVVRRMTAIAQNSGCHILYLSGDADAHADQMLAALKGSDVLTVTDAKANRGNDGIISFVMKDNRVRFDIDDAEAASGGLVIDSRLLNLALEVKPRR
jgi:hypothetical protein